VSASAIAPAAAAPAVGAAAAAPAATPQRDGGAPATTIIEAEVLKEPAEGYLTGQKLTLFHTTGPSEFEFPRAAADERSAWAKAPRAATVHGRFEPSIHDPANMGEHPVSPYQATARAVEVAIDGAALALAAPPLPDRRTRTPPLARAQPFGATLRPGEAFRFDLSFAGNPAGLAEARIVAEVADPRGPAPAGAPWVVIEGRARTSGIVSLLANVTDEVVTRLDAATGASITSVNTIHFDGWNPKGYRHRVTTSHHDGRGRLRVHDDKDGKVRVTDRPVPPDTFDALGAMAWVRSLRLAPGERAKAHALDGIALMRVEFVSRGALPMPERPSIAAALGIAPDGIELLEGTLTRVDRTGQPLPGKRVMTVRVWVSADARRIPLRLESDLWASALRLELNGYDPPRDTGAAPPSLAAGAAPPANPAQ
jgi:hypothetical protein